jgi:hypothetical protein
MHEIARYGTHPDAPDPEEIYVFISHLSLCFLFPCMVRVDACGEPTAAQAFAWF